MKTEARVVGVPFRAPWTLSTPHDSAGTQEIALPMDLPGSLRVSLGVCTAWQAAAFSLPSLRVLCLLPPWGQGFPTWQMSGRAPRVTGGPLCLLVHSVRHALPCHGPALPGLPSALGCEVRKPRLGLCPSESQVVPASRFRSHL